LIRTLVKLLKDSQDAAVLAVAAHDAGQYAKHYERGGVYEICGSYYKCTELTLDSVLNELGAKTRIMELMSHSHPDVRYQSLVTVQRLVSKSWVR
jgi:V-type H+-transporting ATPase subunit H